LFLNSLKKKQKQFIWQTSTIHFHFLIFFHYQSRTR